MQAETRETNGKPIAQVSREPGILKSRILSWGKKLPGMDSHPSLEASNVTIQRLLVQQPVQQRRRKAAYIGDTQRTPDPGIKHAEEPPRRFPYALPSFSITTSRSATRLDRGVRVFGPFLRNVATGSSTISWASILSQPFHIFRIASLACLRVRNNR